VLRPLAKGAPLPEAPDPVVLKEAESYTTVEALDAGLAVVYDQDTGNLEMQQRGIVAAKANVGAKSAATLGNYQEIRIRRIHKTLDGFLSV
jgi:hypothetical protein